MKISGDASADAGVGMENVSTVWLTGDSLLGDSVVFAP
jgi:hypothetical protein